MMHLTGANIHIDGGPEGGGKHRAQNETPTKNAIIKQDSNGHDAEV
jgi:hypothetical protein